MDTGHVEVGYLKQKLNLIYMMRINPYWQLETYGSAITINSGLIKALFVFACMVTIGTNWLIPIFINKINDIKIRYG